MMYVVGLFDHYMPGGFPKTPIKPGIKENKK